MQLCDLSCPLQVSSAKPIKNAKNPWSWPKAKLQSFLFHLTHAKKLSNSLQAATATKAARRSDWLWGDLTGFQFPTCIVVTGLLQMIFCKYAHIGHSAVWTLKGWHSFLVVPLKTNLCLPRCLALPARILSCFSHCNDLHLIQSSL